MTGRIALTGARIFDGDTWHERSALVIDNGIVEGLIAADSPTDARRVPVDGAMLVPGFVDLQVNGGGGVLLNEAPTLDGIRTICETHARFGTTALLPTLITDTPEVTLEAAAAGAAAASEQLPGFLGLHLEGPHLSLARKGAHDPGLIRAMQPIDIDRLAAARRALPNLLVTVAAETVDHRQIAALRAAGLVVSIGHSDASYALVKKAADAGATMVTHLFNAQSQMGNREPGVVGAALDLGELHAGLIADGIHVDAATIGIALRAKRGPGRIFLVTDAMSLTGTDRQRLTLNGREIIRAEGALRLADGTLAGADLTMIAAVSYMHRTIGLPLEEALRMAALYPAEALGVPDRGHLRRGAAADFTTLSVDLDVRSTWIGGNEVFRG
ncbi:MAG TPA: N-acetylglucosamine-6-phosphate deacetylase [Devosiaceae bacterium]|jgi:N-acetylglucosamine-6-phosphate deacetylase|nr:N-acetylglucosamine-6-phosphate deacetylase [Devosiaceae bacterium]